jgi:hypothetical protein
MKITEHSGAESLASTVKSQETKKTERSGSAQTGAVSGAQGGDRVEFSAGLGQLSRAISSYGSQRTGQVEALTALYQSGNYVPDSGATSRSMIAEALSGSAA